MDNIYIPDFNPKGFTLDTYDSVQPYNLKYIVGLTTDRQL